MDSAARRPLRDLRSAHPTELFSSPTGRRRYSWLKLELKARAKNIPIVRDLILRHDIKVFCYFK